MRGCGSSTVHPDRVRGRELAQDETVSRRRNQRRLEAKLGELAGAGAQLAGLEQDHPRRRLARPVVHVDARAAAQRAGAPLQDDRGVDEVGGCEPGPGSAEQVAAADLPPADRGQCQRHALACRRRLDRAVVHLHRAHPQLATGREQRQAIPGAHFPDHSVPVTTVPMPRSEKERST